MSFNCALDNRSAHTQTHTRFHNLLHRKARARWRYYYLPIVPMSCWWTRSISVCALCLFNDCLLRISSCFLISFPLPPLPVTANRPLVLLAAIGSGDMHVRVQRGCLKCAHGLMPGHTQKKTHSIKYTLCYATSLSELTAYHRKLQGHCHESRERCCHGNLHA